MGYTTEFTGVIGLSRELTLAEARDLLDAAGDGKAICQSRPQGHLRWVPTEDLRGITWDQGEKFYDYVEWMECVCAWLSHLGIVCNGEIAWSGEEADDTGRIYVRNNDIVASRAEGIKATGARPLTVARLGQIALERAIAGGAK